MRWIVKRECKGSNHTLCGGKKRWKNKRVKTKTTTKRRRSRSLPRSNLFNSGSTTLETSYSISTYTSAGCLPGAVLWLIRTRKKETSWSTKLLRCSKRWSIGLTLTRKVKYSKSWWTVLFSTGTKTWWDSCSRSTQKSSRCNKTKPWSSWCSKPWAREVVLQKRT